MRKGKFDINVYAYWIGLDSTTLIGVLSAHFAIGKKAFSFEYDLERLKSKLQHLLDPDLDFFSGAQYPKK